MSAAAAAEDDMQGRLGEAAERQARTERVVGFNASHGVPPRRINQSTPVAAS
jgi:hypothetical protein